MICLDDLKQIDMLALWNEHLKLAEVDHAALLRHVPRNHNQSGNAVHRLTGILKRISTLELGGEHYLSIHNLCVEAGMRASYCRPINANPYLPNR